MAGRIDTRPSVVNLLIYAGDGLDIKLTFLTKDGAAIDITGSVAAQIRPDRTHPNDPPLVAFNVNMVDAYEGVIVLSLTEEQTISLLDGSPDKFEGVWDVQWTPEDEEPKTVIQGDVECTPDVTR